MKMNGGMTMENCTQFCVPIPNKPGTLANMTGTMMSQKINITGLMIEDFGDISYVRFNADKPGKARSCMMKAGYEMFENPGFCLEMPNKPGMLHKLSRKLGSKGINIRNIYCTADGAPTCRMMVMVDEPKKAMPQLKAFCREMGGRMS